MGNESEDFQDAVNMTGYPKVCKAALDAQTLAELEFAMHRQVGAYHACHSTQLRRTAE
jgi:hypothetical protein